MKTHKTLWVKVLLAASFIPVSSLYAKDPTYADTRLPIPGQIEMENFVSNNGTVPSVDTPRYEAGGGEVIRGMANGSSANYAVNVTEAGLYEIKLRYAKSSGGAAQLQLFSGSTELFSRAIQGSGSSNVFNTLTIRDVSLGAGNQTLSARFTGAFNGVSFNWMAFRLQPSSAAPQYNIFVSPNGNDTANGSQGSPYKTFKRAVQRVEQLNSNQPNHGPIVINLREGYHEITSTINMGGAAKAKARGHVTVRPYQNEQAILGGGRRIPNSAFSAVTDNATLNRLKPVARGKVFRARLNDANWQARFPGGYNQSMVSFNNVALQLARFPNKGLVTATNTTGTSFKTSPGIDAARWRAEFSRSGDMAVIGHFNLDEFDQQGLVTQVNTDGRIIMDNNKLTGSGRKLRIVNVMAELDMPGEWYYDKVSKDFYIWPPSPISLNPVIRVGSNFAALNGGGLEYWTFRDLTFQDVGGTGGFGGVVNAFNFTGNNLLIGGNTFRNCFSRATLRVTGRFNRVTGNDFYDLVSPVVVSGGGERTLPAIPCQSECTNNHIYNIYNRAYGGGGVSGVGVRYANNVNHGHNAGITYTTSQDALLELNEWYDVGYELGDWNVAYVGATYANLGTVIRHNFVHNMVRPSNRKRTGALRGDDGTTGLNFVGNIFYKTGDYCFATGGAGTTVANNIAVETESLLLSGPRATFLTEPTRITTRAQINAEYAANNRVPASISPSKISRIYNAEQALGDQYWTTPYFSYKYPITSQAYASNPFDSAGMQVRRNYAANVRRPYTPTLTNITSVTQYVADAEDIVSIPASSFVDLNTLNMNFKSGFQRVPGFWTIPFDNIGLYVDEFRKSVPHKATYRAGAKLKWNQFSSNRGPANVNPYYPEPNFVRGTTYDLGSYTSPLFTGAKLLTPQTRGSYGWTNNGGLNSANRGQGNPLNTDIIYSSQTKVFEQEVENGNWYALVTFGDTAAHDRMSVRAERTAFESANQNFNTNAGQYVNKLVKARVTDGRFSIEISDNGGSDANWAVARIIVQNAPFSGQSPVEGSTPPPPPPSGGDDTNSGSFVDRNEYLYDFGTPSSPVANSYTKLTERTTQGYVRWANNGGIRSVDRGNAQNALNRDFVYSNQARTLIHQVANGNYRVTVNLFDASFRHDNMQVKAEGQVKLTNQTWGAGSGNQTLDFEVSVSDGNLNLEFSDQGGSDQNWVLNRLIVTKLANTPPPPPAGGGGNGDGTGTAPQTTSASNTGSFYNAAKYQWDFGSADSPLSNGYGRVTEATTQGYARWANNSGVRSVDRGGSQNALNRDFVYSNQAKTFSQEIANGTYEVAVNLFDANYLHDNMQVRAEGQVKLSNQTFGASAGNDTKSFNVTVNDGQLDLEFSDQGGNDANWVLNRIVVTRSNSSGDGNSGGGSSQPLQFDFGTASSPLQADYVRVSPDTRSGDYRWTNTVSATDRGTAGNANNLNRDLNYSNQNRNFEVTGLANGNWQVEVTIGDASYPHDNIRVRTRGGIIFNSESVARNQFKVESRIQNVTDGKIVITFSDEGGNDRNWVVTRVRLLKQ